MKALGLRAKQTLAVQLGKNGGCVWGPGCTLTCEEEKKLSENSVHLVEKGGGGFDLDL